MNNKCNTCAKFLTCKKKECKKVTFVEAGILERPKTIKEKNLKKQNIYSFDEMTKVMQKIGISAEKWIKRNNTNKRGIEDKLIIRI